MNLLDWDYSQNVGAKYSSSLKVLLLQHKHYTAVIKTNIIYFETEVKTSVALNDRQKIYGPYLKEKYHATVYYLKYMISPHPTLLISKEELLL